jgi:hypothetical protein
MRALHRRVAIAILVASSAATFASPGRTQPAGPAVPSADAVKEAENHFRRGVALYKDGDAAGALVEFKRTYELAPNFHILFNLGQTYFQLQHYADALRTLQEFLAEGGTQIGPDRRASVEADILQLQARVGQVDVKVSPDGATIFVDDELLGTAPLALPVVVSVGRRKFTATKPGLPPQERFLEVASGDHATLSIDLAPGPAAAPALAPASSTSLAPGIVPASALASTPMPAPAPEPARPGPWIAWGMTGVLGAATVVTGILTLAAKSDLSNQLDTFPGNPGAIDDARTRTKTMGIVTDVLLGASVVAAGVAIYVTVAGHARHADAALAIGPSGIHLGGHF